MSWHVQNSKLLEKVKRDIKHNYVGLRVEVDSGTVYIRGALSLKSGSGKEIEVFLIEIELPPNYPMGIPVTREVGGRFPKLPDRHFNPDDSACLFLPDERYKCFPVGSDILLYIEDCVIPFLFWQLDFELKSGVDPLPARGHGEEGIIEFYMEELQTKDYESMLKGMKYLSAKKVKSHWECYCGSAERIGDCHLKHLNIVREHIAKKSVRASYEKLQKYPYHALVKLKTQNSNRI